MLKKDLPYRDHLMRSFNVFLLGYFIANKQNNLVPNAKFFGGDDIYWNLAWMLVHLSAGSIFRCFNIRDKERSDKNKGRITKAESSGTEWVGVVLGEFDGCDVLFGLVTSIFVSHGTTEVVFTPAEPERA